jgi:hypothetical protein
MKASELRIGSKVGCKVSNDSGIYTVCAFPEWTHESSQPVTIDRCGYETHPVDKLRGIPLTPEWLERFGFDNSPAEHWSFGYSTVYGVFRKGGITYNSSQKTFWYHGVLENQPKYVHQLQNLYFALTGTELTLKEEENTK